MLKSVTEIAMSLVTFSFIFATFDVYSVEKEGLPNALCHPTICITSHLVCLLKTMLYDFSRGADATARFANSLMPVNSAIFSLAALRH